MGTPHRVRRHVSSGVASVLLTLGSLAPLAIPADAAAATSPGTWSLMTTPVPSDAYGSASLEGVSCVSASVCMAVGYSFDSDTGASLPLAESLDGTTWTAQTPPSPAGSYATALSSVSCTSASNCVAVGYARPFSGGFPIFVEFAEVWNGAGWTIQTTPGVGGNLNGVSCVSASACIAVGESSSGRTLAEAWNGADWTVQTTPNPPGTPNSVLSGVSCRTADRCTAVGESSGSVQGPAPLAEAWHGHRWTIQPTSPAAGGDLVGVSCATATACTAVGSDAGGVPLAEGLNGAVWTIQSTASDPAAITSAFYGISCRAAADCTAVGYAVTSSVPYRYGTLAEQWDGTAWTIQATPNPPLDTESDLHGVSCRAAAACFAVGSGNVSTPDVSDPLAESRHG